MSRGRKEPSSEVLAAVCDSLRIDLPDLLAEVRRDLYDRAPILRLADARLQRAARLTRSQISRPTPRTGGPTMHSSGDVMLLAA